ncbi:primosomal protein DnaI [Lactobacillus sp. M0398]|uniref:primosomal protein DnaI n=1 Tax=unclassified Lactobacillus TaxID=2620435 RepID=UPI0018DEA5DA|nr:MULTISPECIES: primosomal protein DnaI [unclassified Lactobacillus]MBI0121707.1 primosomal protein DnaI [Lactobacillus sp. M0398]MBI0122198.1 primosomal protein DnaI [Lactobacillus sp. W8174]MBI0134738.1 primosomal protein DnaI [Lactobacillus sp. W8173]
MQPIKKIIDKTKNVEEESTDSIKKKVLADPKINQFIKQHQEQLTDSIIDKSLPSLFEFYLSQHKKDPVTKGYYPDLIMNKNAISLKFVPEDSKLIHDHEINIKKHLRLINLPEKLHDVRLSRIDMTSERVEVMTAIQQFLYQYSRDIHQKGLYLAGNFGVGKTYILAGLANQVAAMNKYVVFLHVPTFIASLSSHFNDNSLQNEVQKIANADFLVLDDIGAENLSQWSRDEVLAVILQARMDNAMPTFFSSNFAMNDLEDHFKETKNAIEPVKAARLMERIRALAKEVIISGPNRRT